MVYLDNNATTPLAPEVFEAMRPFLLEQYGNASSLYQLGVDARYAVEKARMRLAKALRAEPESIIFTGSGTEADNLALKGVAFASQHKGRHIITSQIEHKAVLNSCKVLQEHFGFPITYLPVDSNGIVALDELERSITPETILISIMYANNEVGSVQPIEEIGRIAREHGILFHTDAVQAFGRLPIDLRTLPVDLLAVSAHKIYGPKGIGALVLRPGVEIHPLIHGGGQERRLRAGTDNVAGIVGFGRAAELALRDLGSETDRQKALRDRLYTTIRDRLSGVHLNGNPLHCLPNTLSLAISGISGQRLVMEMSQRGVAISAGSACTSGGSEPSYVLLAMGLDDLLARGAVRISLGRKTTMADVELCGQVLPEMVESLRATASPAESEKGIC